MANEDPIYLAIKWSLIIINAISAVYVAIIFFQNLFDGRLNNNAIPFIFNCVVGFLIAWLGAYAAWYDNYNLLIVYGIVLIINLVVASFGSIYKANLGLYVVCVILAFVFAYLIKRGGSFSSAA
jgi:CHASE2 domain-containing sensor protein